MSVLAAFERGGVPSAIAAREAPLAEAAMREGHITTQLRAEHFIAQVLHESVGLRFFEEIASGALYEGRCRDLGNCHPGDGVRYKGRGPIQLTGRANYRRAGAALGLPLEDQPALAARHDVGWRVAVWYWTTHNINALADRDDVLAVTKAINGGTNGLASRKAILARVREVDCKPRPEGPAAWLTAGELAMVRDWDKRNRAGTLDTAAGEKLVARIEAQRKRIWRAAQPKAKGGDGHGWDYRNRRARYKSLKARST